VESWFEVFAGLWVVKEVLALEKFGNVEAVGSKNDGDDAAAGPVPVGTTGAGGTVLMILDRTGTCGTATSCGTGDSVGFDFFTFVYPVMDFKGSLAPRSGFALAGRLDKPVLATSAQDAILPTLSALWPLSGGCCRVSVETETAGCLFMSLL
jgi:hypothetical protein